LPVGNIAEDVNREFQPDPPLNRQDVYWYLRQACEKGILRIHAPIHKNLSSTLANRFGLSEESVQVVSSIRSAPELVSEAAADRAFEIVSDLSHRLKRPVTLGLGPGRASLDFCKCFSDLLRTRPLPQKLRLVAISAGCLPSAPEYAPVSFFNLFPANAVEERLGIFAEPLMKQGEFEKCRASKFGIKEAFLERENIDVVISSMGDMTHNHDMLRLFLKESGVEWHADGQVGNIQFRPYTKEGPYIEAADQLRAVTLFEIHDLRQFAATKEKYVILMARQCGVCQSTKHSALLPLLTVPSLRVFSDLVMDSTTALNVLAQAEMEKDSPNT
jgi:DNA-binding transcriptional regulator LsrR (DeoR family)